MSNRGKSRFHSPRGHLSPGSNPSPARGVERGRGRGRAARGRGGGHLGSEQIEQLYDSVLHSPFRGRGGGRARGRVAQAASPSYLRSSPRGSGPSTPRGYPPRTKATADISQLSTSKGGLGFHLKTPEVPELLSRSPKPLKFGRGSSDPRLLVPVKFVKATALTDASLLNLGDQSLEASSTAHNQTSELDVSASAQAKTNHNSNMDPLSPFNIINPSNSDLGTRPLPSVSKDDQWELEEFGDRSPQNWKTLFPGIFKIESPASTESLLQHSGPSKTAQEPLKSQNTVELNTSTPGTRDSLSQIITQTESISLGSLDHLPDTTVSVHSLAAPSTDPASRVVGSSADKSGCSKAVSTENLGANQGLPHRTAASSRHDSLNFQAMEPPELKSTEESRIKPYALDCNTSKAIPPCPEPQVSKSVEQFGSSFTIADDITASGAQFYVDEEGDPTNMSSTCCAHRFTLDRASDKESDDEDEIVFQPQPTNSIAPSDSASSDDLHFFRIITDQSHPPPQQPHQEPPSPEPNQPKPSSSKFMKKAHKIQKRLRRKERREAARRNASNNVGLSHPHKVDIDHASDIDWGDEDNCVANLFSTSKDKSFGKSRNARRRACKEKEEMEIWEDYIMHTMMSEVGSEDEEVTKTTMVDGRDLIQNMMHDKFLNTFLRGMDSGARQQKTIDDLDQQAQERIDDEILANGWVTDSSNSDGDLIEDLQLNDLLGSDQDLLESESSDSEDYAGQDRLVASTSFKNKKSAGKSPQVDSDPGSDSDILEIDSEELPTFSKDILTTKKKKGKQSKKNFLHGSDEELIEFVEELQLQWKKDRARKAEKKRARADARLLSSPKTAKQRKKANRRESGKPSQVFDLIDLDRMIKDFVTFEPDEFSLSLPPVNKKTRASVHQLAALYGLKSKSMGSGNNRYPVLQRTHRTDVKNVNKNKLRAILRHQKNSDDFFESDNGFKGGYSSVHRLPRNREGDIVGDGVAHIGEENIGFKLLTKMGWSMGQTIGDPNNRSALQKPLMAVMKNSKGGLGLSSFSK